MADRLRPRYPIYVPSKGRAQWPHTIRFLLKDDVHFYVVVEDAEHDQYAAVAGEHRILVLPFSNAGSVIPARNWIRKHSMENGFKRHWQLDDNIRNMMRRFRGSRIECDANVAMRTCEDFSDRYTNIAISGMNYDCFAVGNHTPFILNCRVYSGSLINNEAGLEWRGKYNEDTGLCLQALSQGWCTVLFNAYLIQKMWTMQLPGGNTTEIYQGDGRLRMARHLERLWPKVVTTKRRFQRPQHVVHQSWRKFDTPLKRRDDIDWDNLDATIYETKLVQKKADQIGTAPKARR